MGQDNMQSQILDVRIVQQPDLTTCGPTSLHAVYNYFNDNITLDQIVNEIPQFEDGGGTLAVTLGLHALKNGYEAKIYSYNINIFDPTWFKYSNVRLIDALESRKKNKSADFKQFLSIKEYIKFLENGGQLLFENLTTDLLKKYIGESLPILAGLSSTWLYQDSREDPLLNIDDPVTGDPSGHFVIIKGITESENNSKKMMAHIADPYFTNPIGNSHYYSIDINRLINSILLGVTSYDGNLLIIKKKV